MKKEQLDLDNRIVWIPDSKTPNGVAEVPLTEIAVDTFRKQLALSGISPFLLPNDQNVDGYQKAFKTDRHATLHRAVFDTFAFTVSDRHRQPGSAPGAWPTSL